MAMINYADKVALNQNSNIADINKVKADDMNELKNAFNNQVAFGWYKTGLNPTFTFVSWDSTTYTGVVSTNIDLTAYLTAGMKIKLTQNSAVKYAFITAITSTQITLFMGSQYSLNNSTISNTYFSMLKAPYGFPLNETYWQVIVSNAATNYTNNPTADTWYNNNSMQLKVPIGMWKLGYKVYARSRISIPTTTPYIDTFVTLSTTTNTETLPKYTVVKTFYSPGLQGTLYDNDCYYNFAETQVVTTPTIFYLLIKYQSAGTPTSIGFAGTNTPTDIKATIAYL